MIIKGRVLEPGAVQATAKLSGPYTVSVQALTADGLTRIKYPDGFIKHHQVVTVDQLIEQVTTVLTRKYGASSVAITKVPSAVKAGAEIGVKI